MRLLGRFTKSWCLVCKSPCGPDCGDGSPTKRQKKRQETRQWKKEINDSSD